MTRLAPVDANALARPRGASMASVSMHPSRPVALGGERGETLAAATGGDDADAAMAGEAPANAAAEDAGAAEHENAEGRRDYFFRKASSATTSPGFYVFSSERAGGAGGAVSASPGDPWNCKPNLTAGSAKAVMASNGMVSRSGLFWKLKVTEKLCSSTSRYPN